MNETGGQIGSALSWSPIRYGTSPCPQSRTARVLVCISDTSTSLQPIFVSPSFSTIISPSGFTNPTEPLPSLSVATTATR